jgi:LPXTG-motif cell wall-anchored protein
MKKVRWVSAAAGMALVAATFALPAAGVAYAAGNPGNGNTVGNGNLGVGSGNTITAPVSLPINLCGISVAILGGASSSCVGGASSNTNVGGSGTGGSGGAGGNGNVVGNRNLGVVSGNTVTAPISAPVNLCGVSGAVGGFANSGCTSGSHTNTTIGSGGSGGGGGTGTGNGNVIGNGNASVLSGNTITAPISAPVNLCGVSLALLGFSNSGCVGGASTDVTVLPGSGNGNTVGNGNLGVGSGNTITAPVSLPVNVCGVSLAVLGFSNSECQGGASTCTDSQCTPPGCTGNQCPPPCRDDHCPPPCHQNQCPPPCHKDQCPPPCHKDQCPPPCHKDQCPPPCHKDHCPPPCHGDHCPPPCHGDHCTPPGCHGDHCTPPGCTTHCTPPTCQGNCTPPGNNTPPPGSTPPGSTTTVTTSTLPSGSLPTTGANLLALLVGGLGALAVGAGTIVLARRRRSGEAS